MKVVSLFSGCGGLDLGFVNGGFKVVWANDIFVDAVATYRHNLGAHIVDVPLEKVPSSAIPPADGVIGGFPCQGFSVANKGRSVDDSRNRLYRQFVRVVRDKQPKFFLAENVKGILSLGGGAVFAQIVKDFGDVGFEVRHSVCNAADYGVPQRRERVFLFGVRRGVRADLSKFPPPPTHSEHRTLFPDLRPWVSIGEALRGLPEPSDNCGVANHTGTGYKIRLNGYLGHRRIDADKPAPTITARGDDRGGVVIIHHPSNTRRLTVREAAAVQSFPHAFKFEGSNTSAYRQIGNAVPPLLAEWLAKSVHEVFAVRKIRR